ncbi:MAG: NAD(P)-dependent glycerol-3-phosphate dehydrogenase [Clostridia bacterium]|nr:NAD(P)-dependent glycerol-3-phosphate dehydrogenase [Clostridia bacterium]
MCNIGVLGAGTWGIALAKLLCDNNHNVTVWSAIERETENLSHTRKHPNLKQMVIPDDIDFTFNISDACADKDIVIFAVPSLYVRATAEKAVPFVSQKTIIVTVAKGIEAQTLFTMSEVIEDVINSSGKTGDYNIVALSGPTHAEEVAMSLPTTIVAASDNLQSAKYVQDAVMNDTMRVYTNSDIKGVELSGAFKNIIALASGISTGIGNGDNAKAAIITRGMAEITRLGIAAGCREDTFFGLAGIGDLIVTATSQHSRNNRAGKLIGEGYSSEEATKMVGMVVEGINALPAAMKLIKRYGIEMPITEAVNSIVVNESDPAMTMNELMNRDKKSER